MMGTASTQLGKICQLKYTVGNTVLKSFAPELHHGVLPRLQPSRLGTTYLIISTNLVTPKQAEYHLNSANVKDDLEFVIPFI
jgi:hypothetical protein